MAAVSNIPKLPPLQGPSSITERRRQLYGRVRREQTERLKQTLCRSHVLARGEYNIDVEREKDGIWLSSTHRDYKGRRPAATGKQYDDANMQLKEHFEIGNDSGRSVPTKTYQLSTTKDDYNKKNVPKPHVVTENRKVNWPDMAPEYAKENAMTHSEYSTSFAKQVLNPSRPKFYRVNTMKTKLPVDKSKSQRYEGVNVQLGSDPASYESEHQSTYNQSAPAAVGKKDREDEMLIKKMAELQRTSCVFRDGDYNNITQDMASTVEVDYGMKGAGAEAEETDALGKERPPMPKMIGHTLKTEVPAVYQEASEGYKDQTSAHFMLGSDEAVPESIYKKDFEPNAKLQREKPVLIKSLPGSQVLQRDVDDNTGKSTTKGEHGNTQLTVAATASSGRPDVAKKNAKIHYRTNFPMSCDQDRNKSDRQVSLAHSDYVPLDIDPEAAVPRKAPVSKYNFLETDPALSFPVPKVKKTQNQYNATGGFMDADWSKEQRQRSKHETKSRVNDLYSTHFSVGNEPDNFESENHGQFTGRPKDDDDVRPAGVVEHLPPVKFEHIKAGNNTGDLKGDPYAMSKMEALVARNLHVTRSLPALPVHGASLTQNDYLHPNDQTLTDAHKRMIIQDDKLSRRPVAASHLFHMDQPNHKNFQTTAMSDYIKPECMEGKQ